MSARHRRRDNPAGVTVRSIEAWYWLQWQSRRRLALTAGPTVPGIAR